MASVSAKHIIPSVIAICFFFNSTTSSLFLNFLSIGLFKIKEIPPINVIIANIIENCSSGIPISVNNSL